MNNNDDFGETITCIVILLLLSLLVFFPKIFIGLMISVILVTLFLLEI